MAARRTLTQKPMQTHFIHSIKRAALLLGILLISACRTHPATATEAPDEAPYTVRNKITSTLPSEIRANNPSLPNVLTAHAWQLTRAVNAEGLGLKALFVDENRPLTVQFNQGRVRISNTCNPMSGIYTLDSSNNALNISSLVSTMMACPQPIMALDAAIAQRLEGALQISIQGNELRIQNQAGDVLVFSK